MRGGRGAAIVVVAILAAPAAARAADSRVLVMPFENVTRNSRIFWLSEASSVLLADDLQAVGVDAIGRDERRQAFERLQVPQAAVLTDATVIRIGQLVGASEVIVGSLELTDTTLTVRSRSITLDTGRIGASDEERGQLTDLFPMFERMARRLAPLGTRTASEATVAHPPLAVFEDYIKGVLADSPATAVNYLNAALKLDPTFDRARLALWDVYSDNGEHQRALEAVLAVGGGPGDPRPGDARSDAGSGSSRTIQVRARFMAGLSELALRKYDEAFATFKSIADQQSSAAALNNLGVVQLRRGATPQTGVPTFYFTKATELDPTDSDFFFNLGYAYWIEHDTQAAIYWLREALRRNPADGDAHYVLGAALAAAGKPSESSREKELARRLSSTYEQWDRRPAAESVPRGLERIKSGVELPHGRALDAAVTGGEQQNQQELARFYVDRGRRLFEEENDRDALAELNRALYLSPYDADAHLLVGRIHLRGGRVHQAIDDLKISLWSRDSVDGHVALGDAYLANRQPDAARAEADRALALDPQSTEARKLLQRVEAK
jgi:tetratricopeptide (TPR) repeat protein